MKPIPELLAVRAVNQYRRRDVVGYLGLRFYLDNTCSIRDQWAREVASRLVLHGPSPCYHTSFHFKEFKADGHGIEHRRLCLPTPNEMIAESALLAECAHVGTAFLGSSSVYSYMLASGNERRGVFLPYFSGFRRRHEDIARAARQHHNGVVLYADIRRFYPSISTEVARRTWETAAGLSKLPQWARDLGMRLIENYASACEPKEEKGIVTGPMFSHLIANLVLRTLDEEMSRLLPGGYFRYVDDIAMVGSQSDVPLCQNR